MNHFCTIASKDYLPFVETLSASLQSHGSCTLHVLISEDEITIVNSETINYYSLQDVCRSEDDRVMLNKYRGNNNHLRWALKPVFMQFLLQQTEKLVYLDNDIFFFHPYQFLFDELNDTSILLTPHWCSFDSQFDEENFMMNFRAGLYNAGFVGATRQALPTLNWWAKVCTYHMSQDMDAGYFVDQRYLDLVPVIDPKAKILRHEGCNIGSWNSKQNKRTLLDGKVVINDKFPVVFVHFNNETIRHISNGNDRLLLPYLQQYVSTFESGGIKFEAYKNSLATKSNAMLAMKRKLKLRTRVKQFLLKLSDKL